MQGAGENYALDKLLMMSQWCLVKRHCFPSDLLASALCSPFNKTHEKKAAELLCDILTFFPLFSLPSSSSSSCLCGQLVPLPLPVSLPIPSHLLPLRGPDLAPENVLERVCSAGGDLLMQAPQGSVHWTGSTYRRCDSFHLTVNFS